MLVATNVSKSHGATTLLNKVSLTVGGRSRIGVVGPNGVGKTTLLRLLAGLDQPDQGSVSRTPPGLAVGYLPQEPDALRGETVHDYLARRTGVADAERDLHAAADALAHDSGDSSAQDVYAATLERSLLLGVSDFEARIGRALSEAGFPSPRLEVEVESLSGGEAARAALAAILLARFQVLLLDEPTNNLDFAGLDRLIDFMHETDAGIVVVSHDRDFLARCVERVVDLDEHTHTATEYGGGWEGYLAGRATARRHADEAYTGYVTERDRLVSRLREQRQWAAAGRRKEHSEKLQQRERAAIGWRINRTEKQAANVRITERALARLDPVEKPWEGWELRMDLAPGERSGDVVTRLVDAVVTRGTFRLGPISLEMGWADRVAILGRNGSGKTTLLRALLGDLPLDSGERYLGPGVVVGEMDQARRRLLGSQPLLEAFTQGSQLLPEPARSLLAKFGLTADHVARSTDRLSPGERTRAVLALLMATNVNCIVLDEPTNHLDLPAIEQLEQALDRYRGTLLIVTHDRAMLDHLNLTHTVNL